MLCCQSLYSSGRKWRHVGTNQANFQPFSYVFLFAYRVVAHIPDKEMNRERSFDRYLVRLMCHFYHSKWIDPSDKQAIPKTDGSLCSSSLSKTSQFCSGSTTSHTHTDSYQNSSLPHSFWLSRVRVRPKSFCSGFSFLFSYSLRLILHNSELMYNAPSFTKCSKNSTTQLETRWAKVVMA